MAGLGTGGPRTGGPREVDGEDLDVLVVGAGLSGIGAACRLRQRLPGRRLAVLEARDAIGGTWDLFRYPGIRSDSDMFTLGYPFRPWTGGRTLADGTSIRRYVQDTARESGVAQLVRFGHRVVRAAWSSAEARWRVHVERGPQREAVVFTCRFLFCCTGYYRYDAGHAPRFAGRDDFAGPVVHPQHWPADLDVRGRRVVVVGSGATAVTLVPALADLGAHVTMLQRSPGYVLSLGSRDRTAERLQRLLPIRAAIAAVRWRNVATSAALYRLSRRRPELVKRFVRRKAVQQLPVGFDVDTHFAPRYQPWDQRMCFAADGDLFRALRSGRAEVVTAGIDRLTAAGVRLDTGAELPADVVVTATGLELLLLGGVALEVDGVPVDPAGTVVHKGAMLSGVPNLALTIGYTNASWTLKADLVAEHVCRLLRHMDRRGHDVVTPLAPPEPATEPLIDLRAGYVLRALDRLPRQGRRAPWRLHQNYPRDLLLLRHGRLGDGLVFSRRPPARGAPAPARPPAASARQVPPVLRQL
ncbi:NAD(P)/FAD-dependent oxidoreductase [Kineococcus glutinatus]|uniref:NAD(P)/FAD-dependent oxidoreductase n=1 Tax=Kineococcus glutinatus TaxID=1070872 RepID=A0ABP8VCK4_9ACTN